MCIWEPIFGATNKVPTKVRTQFFFSDTRRTHFFFLTLGGIGTTFEGEERGHPRPRPSPSNVVEKFGQTVCANSNNAFCKISPIFFC